MRVILNKTVNTNGLATTDNVEHRNEQILPKSKQERLFAHRVSALDRMTNQIETRERYSSVINIRDAMHDQKIKYVHSDEWKYVPPEGYEINTKISDDVRLEYQKKFNEYLQTLCNRNDRNAPLPADCDLLMHKMVNISIRHSYSLQEVHTLAQRIEYLSSIIPQRMPIPKCAGTSLASTFGAEFTKRFHHWWAPHELQISPIFKRNNARQKLKSHMVFGHLPYGMHKVFIATNEKQRTIWTEQQWVEYTQSPNSNTQDTTVVWINKLNYTYCTVLRHPLSRVSSHFYYHQADEKDTNHKWTKNRNLEQWVGFMEDSKDCAVAHISGSHPKSWWNVGDETIGKLLPYRNDRQPPSPDYVVAYKYYEIARWNLMNMGWVGIYEQLQESMDQLQFFWNIKRTKMRWRNVNHKKPKNALSEQERNKILAFNKGDLWLYELGVILCKQQQIVLKYLR